MSTPPALKQELPVASGYSPVYVVGNAGSARIYAISQSSPAGGLGQVSAIETGGNTISTTIPVGRDPIYGVMTLDNRRAFILNQTSGTVTVINEPNNALDTPINTIPVGVRPVWAVRPVNTLNMTAPKEKTSDAAVNGSPRACSGET